jgi:hypothetical protein
LITYDNGDLVRCSAIFTNSSGTATDPSVVRFQVRNPAGTVTPYLYGTDIQLVKDSTGNYHVDVDASSDGLWSYRFYSTGSGQAAAEANFIVSSNFV